MLVRVDLQKLMIMN